MGDRDSMTDDDIRALVETAIASGGQLGADALPYMTPDQVNAARRNGNLDNLLNGKQDNA
jgi:hypothetical protein